MKKLIAKTDVSYSNSMVEAMIKHIKYNYLFKVPIYTPEQCVQFLNILMNHYNNKPRPVLNGKTPNEVFELKDYPISTEQWQEHCLLEKSKRISENKTLFCQKCAP